MAATITMTMMTVMMMMMITIIFIITITTTTRFYYSVNMPLVMCHLHDSFLQLVRSGHYVGKKLYMDNY
jgi:hypothetical protein